MMRQIMIQGTMSSSGKTTLAAGFCRIFKEEGFKVAPFKSQNMASATYTCADGGVISVAQALQAAACGLEPRVEMNPIVLLPRSEMGSEVYVLGKSQGEMQAGEYFSYKKELRPLIMQVLERLTREFELLVLEGAGSPAEINLNQDDIVNMGLAEMADAPVLLVADIDRGGVFASIYGTIMLLPEAQRARIKGVLINKFRGDVALLLPGLKMIEALTGVPVLGVIPYLELDFSSLELREASFAKLTACMREQLDISQILKISEDQ